MLSTRDRNTKYFVEVQVVWTWIFRLKILNWQELLSDFQGFVCVQSVSSSFKMLRLLLQNSFKTKRLRNKRLWLLSFVPLNSKNLTDILAGEGYFTPLLPSHIFAIVHEIIFDLWEAAFVHLCSVAAFAQWSCSHHQSTCEKDLPIEPHFPNLIIQTPISGYF